MDFLMQLLTGSAEIQKMDQSVVVILAFVAVFILILALLMLCYDIFDPVRSRLQREASFSGDSVDHPSVLAEKLRKHDKVFVPSDEPLVNRTAMRLNHGGFHGKNALLYYYGLRMLLMIVLPLLALVIAGLTPAINGDLMFLMTLAALIIGYVAPSFTLDKIIAKRQKNIYRAFPEALDLLVICSEAGLSLDSAILKVATEISISQPKLAEELNIVIAETRTGVERHKALQRLVERTGVEEIKGLISTLTQSMRFGTGVAEALKVYSEDLRDRRLQAAEEIAAKVSVKLLFPLALFLLPAFMLVLMLPAALALKGLALDL